MSIPERFDAFRIHGHPHRAAIEKLRISDLNDGELTVKVDWSGVNYKDALAGTGRGKILRQFPLVGGIDLAGHVAESRDPRFHEGDAVLVTGSGLSETRDGGYSEYQRVQADWTIPVPATLSLRETMGIGTAGFTAALCLLRMQAIGQKPEMGPIVVTGATGGVGTLAIDIFTRAGFEVHAITGKTDKFDALISIGARQCISRDGLYLGQRPLETATWAGAVDNVGGDILSGLTRMIHPWGSIASCGLAGGIDLHTTVMPFIIRGVSLLGINSSATPYAMRADTWQRLAQEWRPRHLEKIITAETDLLGLPAAFDNLMAGGAFGRTVVRIGARDSGSAGA